MSLESPALYQLSETDIEGKVESFIDSWIIDPNDLPVTDL